MEGEQTQMCPWPDLNPAHLGLWLYLLAASNANLETPEPFSGLRFQLGLQLQLFSLKSLIERKYTMSTKNGEMEGINPVKKRMAAAFHFSTVLARLYLGPVPA